jgi:hypothetical protein
MSMPGFYRGSVAVQRRRLDDCEVSQRIDVSCVRTAACLAQVVLFKLRPDLRGRHHRRLHALVSLQMPRGKKLRAPELVPVPGDEAVALSRSATERPSLAPL